ncbi:hypothetical protein [Acinetobacter nosocomialis]|uniref:hypothetical protein n=1 Tax=Acinetobacter nosocomialis TaxID=106654 RepID=UPI00237E4F6A|nr:hypothetical protein [Acinetobacter nosocomialis]MDE1667349.1 hypothetical protein [Acinetobacter nosocomialis]
MRLNEDNVINAKCIFGIVVSICFMLIVILKSFYGEIIEITFIKDIFSIGATLAAALIAISLYNDWKEQHNLKILAQEAKDAFHLFHLQRNIIHNFKYQMIRIINEESNEKISEKNIALEFQQKLIATYNVDKDKMSAFCFLSEGQSIFDITMQYYDEINESDKKLAAKANQLYSDTRFLDKKSSKEFLRIFKSLEDKNTAILKELKSYIFFQ